MKNQIQKDKSKRNLRLKFENKCIILKSIVRNNNVTKTIRWNSELKLGDLKPNSHKNRQVNRCVLTGRKSKFNSAFRFSRLSFLKFARNGLICGLRKSAR
jgi:ribosomal protein S14